MSNTEDLYGSYHFLLEIQGVINDNKVIVGGFKSVSGMDSETEIVEFKQGNDIVVRKKPGRTTYNNIVLERGYTATDDLWQWRKNIEDGKIDRRAGSIDGAGRPHREDPVTEHLVGPEATECSSHHETEARRGGAPLLQTELSRLTEPSVVVDPREDRDGGRPLALVLDGLRERVHDLGGVHSGACEVAQPHRSPGAFREQRGRDRGPALGGGVVGADSEGVGVTERPERFVRSREAGDPGLVPPEHKSPSTPQDTLQQEEEYEGGEGREEEPPRRREPSEAAAGFDRHSFDCIRRAWNPGDTDG